MGRVNKKKNFQANSNAHVGNERYQPYQHDATVERVNRRMAARRMLGDQLVVVPCPTCGSLINRKAADVIEELTKE